MAVTERHHQLAQKIDSYVSQILKSGGDETKIMQGMYDYMGSFKELMDMSKNGELDILCQQYEGFYTFAKLLEDVAKGIKRGTIDPQQF